MADHVAEQIAAKLQTRLEWLKTEQTGYTTVLVDVHRPLPYEEPASGTHLYCELMQGDPDRNEELDSASNPPIIGWSQPFYAAITFDPSASSGQSVDTIQNAIVKDVVRAMFQDPGTPGTYEHTLGGVVLGMDIIAPQFLDATDQSDDAVILGVVCHYQTLENDPSIQP